MTDLPPGALPALPLPTLPAAPAPPATGTGAASGFARTLGMFLDADGSPAPVAPAATPAADGERQSLADGGSDLPEASDDPTDPIAPWLFALTIPLPLPVPAQAISTVTPAPAVPATAGSAAPPSALVPPALDLVATSEPPLSRDRSSATARGGESAASILLPVPTNGETAASPAAPRSAPPASFDAYPPERANAHLASLDIPSHDAGDAGRPIALPDAMPPSRPIGDVAARLPATSAAPADEPGEGLRAEIAVSVGANDITSGTGPAARGESSRSDPPAPTAAAAAPSSPATPVGPIAQPARQVFAAAIAAASGWRERTGRFLPAEPHAIDASAMLVPPARSEIAAPHAAHDAPLDLRDERGLQQVVDRIVTLRDDAHDAADARDTRIRLTPDRLGTVDIAVRRDGGDVRVHFTAERVATQTLLAEAQPRLSELAAARGVRIAESSVSTGASAQNAGRQGNAPQQPRSASTRPAPASAEAVDIPTDLRVA